MCEIYLALNKLFKILFAIALALYLLVGCAYYFMPLDAYLRGYNGAMQWAELISVPIYVIGSIWHLILMSYKRNKPLKEVWLLLLKYFGGFVLLVTTLFIVHILILGAFR